MPITLDQSEELDLIRLEGEVTITSSADLKKLLLQALASGRELRVELEQATELDITSMQLLWAAERRAAGSGARLTLSGKIPEGISVAVEGAGFERFLVPSDQK